MYDLFRQTPEMPRETLAIVLLMQFRELAETACPEELAYLAWRLTQLTNDVCFAAGAAQRNRSAQAGAGNRLLPVAA